MKQNARWIGFGRTDVGCVRQSNQDVFAAINSCNFWIIADGMGGHPGGDVAAHLAVDTATQRAKELTSPSKQQSGLLPHEIMECLIAANQSIHNRVKEEPALKGMGTTAVAMTITPTPKPVAHIAHLGDSRAYRFHDGILTQLTRDHSLVNMLLERGLIDEAKAQSYPDKHVLAKGLGMGSEILPELTSIPINDKDLMILCSDGLTKMLDDNAIHAILSRDTCNPRRACHDLVEAALRQGGEDNVTVIVCGFTTPTKSGSLAIDKTLPAM
ncbi:PP2C family protein-serine/threonine phosphatase [Petrachloros mirabilis]